ncbi:hypothetical protein PR202_gb22104 [Eleusine coracana subsp. coracana]|uniref:CASP-like protein n=1 Tax=Eleusine coracana subsp. coracana TaxID=191504 RepID=A0AAV5FGV2_ELECO|nr:hypothetical protein QOZ80_7BG0613830 [Eleusine coracana subsp. coracana]GJN33495.1 hypothetical protein PR202_gb22104 [Eleusine coracana subsp. coracana]
MAMVPAPVETTMMSSSSGKGYKPAAQHNNKASYNATPPEDDGEAVEGIVLVLRGGAAAVTFVAVALVASCRHGDWMEFARYPEYRYLIGASAVACVYSAAQALRNFRRMRRGYTSPAFFLDFAGDQMVAYGLITALSAALPITIRMRSAVINIFTDAMTAAISLSFIAFAALAFSAMLSGFRIAARAY